MVFFAGIVLHLADRDPDENGVLDDTQVEVRLLSTAGDVFFYELSGNGCFVTYLRFGIDEFRRFDLTTDDDILIALDEVGNHLPAVDDQGFVYYSLWDFDVAYPWPCSVHRSEGQADQFVYVALGDSYQSGEGAGWDVLDTNQYLTTVYENGANYTDDAGVSENTYNGDVAVPGVGIGGDGCHRAVENYAKTNRDLLEPGADVVLIDRTCSGTEIFSGTNPIAGGLGSQLDRAIADLAALGLAPEDVDLVTVGMGGNDAGFIELVFACTLPQILLEVLDDYPDAPLEVFALWGFFGDCEDVSKLLAPEASEQSISQLVTIEQSAQEEILSTFENAEVLHLEYPNIIPGPDVESGLHCAGIQERDFEFAASKIKAINGQIRLAASNVGDPRLRVVPTETAFRIPGASDLSNPLCGTQSLVSHFAPASIDAEVARLLNLTAGGDAAGRQLLDDLIATYTQFRDCLNPFNWFDCYVFRNRSTTDDVSDAADEYLNHLVGESDRILGNLANPNNSEADAITLDRLKQLYHPSNEGQQILACEVRGHYAGTPAMLVHSQCFGDSSMLFLTTMDGVTVGRQPLSALPGEIVTVSAGGFASFSSVSITFHSIPIDLGSFTTDSDGVVTEALILPPAEPGVHTLSIDGIGPSGVSRAERVRVFYDGDPEVGQSLGAYICCFADSTSPLGTPDQVAVLVNGSLLSETTLDADGGAFVVVPVEPNIGDPHLDIALTNMRTSATSSVETAIAPSLLGAFVTGSAVRENLWDLVDSDPTLQSELARAIAALDSVLVELAAGGPDRSVAASVLKTAVEVLENAEGLSQSEFSGNADLIAAAGRMVALVAIDEAREAGADQAILDPALVNVDAGDSSWAIEDFSGALSSYLAAANIVAELSCTIIGTEGDDVIQGTPEDDVICGLGGNDIISGGDGDDVVYGGDGNDSIDGGNDDDTIYGGSGDDSVTGGNGTDTVFGGSGSDELSGSRGADMLDGGSDDDVILGGKGDDTIRGGDGDDTLLGQNGSDVIVGGQGVDSADGGPGFDSCVAEATTACE